MSAENIAARLLLGGAGLIFVVLGSVHLLYTFFTKRLHPRDPAVTTAMEQTSPQLTKQTTLWRAWVGFNASHSTGAIFFGFVMCFAALLNLRLYAGSQIIQLGTAANTLFYLWLARKYWFRIPFLGIALSALLQVTALLVIYRVIQFPVS